MIYCLCFFTLKLQKKCPICGYNEDMVFRFRNDATPSKLLLFSLVSSTASNRSKCLAKPQKQEFLPAPPSINMLNPLIPNKAESPWPAGNT